MQNNATLPSHSPCGLPIVSVYDQVLKSGTYLAHWYGSEDHVTNNQLFLVHVQVFMGQATVSMQHGSIRWAIGAHDMLADPVRVLNDDYCAAGNATNQYSFKSGVCPTKLLHLDGPQEVA